MGVGLEVINDSGSIIIDADYLSVQFIAKGSITLDQELSSGTNPTYTDAWKSSTDEAAGGTNAQLIAFRARDSGKPVGVLSGGFGVNYTINRFVGYSTGTAPIVDWWSFGKVAAPGNYGLEVRDAASNVVYSSASPPMVIAAAQSGVNFSATAISAGTGNYALCVGVPGLAVRNGSEVYSGGYYYWLETTPLWEPPTSTGFAAPTVVRAVGKTSNVNYPTGWRGGDMIGSMLLVDVTGL